MDPDRKDISERKGERICKKSNHYGKRYLLTHEWIGYIAVFVPFSCIRKGIFLFGRIEVQML